MGRGGVSGAPQYVYVAAATGRVAAANAHGQDRRVDWTALPQVTSTRPQIGGVGTTEQQARVAGHDCDCRVLTAADIPRALANQDPLRALKIVADAPTGRVLGVHAALEGAGDVMLAATYAIKAGLTVDDLAGHVGASSTPHPRPCSRRSSPTRTSSRRTAASGPPP